MPSLRPLQPIALPDDCARSTDYGPEPERVWVPIGDIMIDDDYQRDLNRRSLALIKKIVGGFKWSKVKTPTGIRVGEQIHLLDGQHTATAAVTLGIPKIPVDIVSARTAGERASAFVAHNQDRLAMTPLDVYRAQLAGGDPEAVAIDKAVKEAGVRLRIVAPQIKPKVGDTGSIGVIRNLIKRRKHAGAVSVMSALVRAERAPISAAELAAVEELMYGNDPIAPRLITVIAKDMGWNGVIQAQAHAKMKGVNVKSALVHEYRRRAKKAAA